MMNAIMKDRLAAKIDAIEQQLPFAAVDGLRELWLVSTTKDRAGIVDICLGEPKARERESCSDLRAQSERGAAL